MIYLDYAATTPIDEAITQSFTLAQTQFFANPNSLHMPGVQAAQLMSDAKAQMAHLLGAQVEELVVTSGATEANNLALLGAARAYKERGNHIITTKIEHASVKKPLQALEKEGFTVTYLPVDKEGRVTQDAVLAAMRPNTILVSIMHINNEIGSIQPIANIAEAVKTVAPKVIIHSDMAQTIGKAPVDLTNIDLATFSGHKFYAPKTIGLLYKKQNIRLKPLFYGGSQEEGLRPGTQNAPLVAAMAKAMRLSFERLTDKKLQADILAKRNDLVHQILKRQQHVRVTLAHDDFTKVSPYIVHFQIVDSQTEIETYLNAFTRAGICLSTRSTCHSGQLSEANPIMRALGYSIAESRRGLRMSLSHLTSRDEITSFGAMLENIVQDLML